MSMLSPDLACRLLDACIIAYDIKNGAIDPSVPFYDKIGIKPGTKPSVFVDGFEEINAGYVAETYDGWVLLVFRGTLPPFEGHFFSWVADWLNDFRAGPMRWHVDGHFFGHVETGFGSALLDLWKDAKQALAAIDMSQKKGILVTGHSKGGGMTFPAATLVKALYPDTHIENCSFAAPLTCDRTFQTNYDAMGLTPVTVRYQNQYDIVPFIPWFPHFGTLATAERQATNGENTVITHENWPRIENDYVRIGSLRYLADGCLIESGDKGQHDADKAIRHALDHLEFHRIAEAHSASGRYHTCVCDSQH